MTRLKGVRSTARPIRIHLGSSGSTDEHDSLKRQKISVLFTC
jgi:hypothetical protein